MSEIIKKQIESYKENFLQNKNSPLGTFQNNTTTQHERFNEVIQPLLKYKSTNFSICDIGSGVCDFHQYLNDMKIKHQYTGVEVVSEMVVESKTRYPEIEVLETDFLADSFTRKFDFVTLSGTFNLPGSISPDAWKSFILQCIAKMYKSCNIGISFNALTNYRTFNDPTLYYLSASDIFHYIQSTLTRFCIINTAYPLYEVSYTALKPETIQAQFNHADFEKYFKNGISK